MNCPKCKTIDLRKNVFDGPWNCQSCGGMWLEKAKIPLFAETTGDFDNGDSKEGLHDEKTGLCPEGHGIMIRAKIDLEKPFFLEKCSTCGGIWFDNGEWQKIINNNLKEGLEEFWCKSWQNKQRKEKSRARYLEGNRRLLGDRIFDEIMDLSKLLKEHPEKGRAIALLQEEVQTPISDEHSMPEV